MGNEFPPDKCVEGICTVVGAPLKRRWFPIDKPSIVSLFGKGCEPFADSHGLRINYQGFKIDVAPTTNVGPDALYSLSGMAGDTPKVIERHTARRGTRGWGRLDRHSALRSECLIILQKKVNFRIHHEPYRTAMLRFHDSHRVRHSGLHLQKVLTAHNGSA